MNRTIIALILIFNIAFSANAAFLKRPNKAAFSVFNQLQSLENADFGKRLLDTIALQMNSQSPLADIARMLAEIREDLVGQQGEADALHNQQEQECADTIAQLDRCISENSNARESAEAEIEVLEAEIAQLHAEINTKELQLQILNTRDVELDAARARDAEAFALRQQQAPQVVEALDLIVDRLSNIQSNDNDASLALAELAKIGNSNPIMSLVQIAMTFSQESLDNVVGKMNRLKESIEASVVEDQREEQEAIAEYQSLKAEIAQTRTNIQNSLADLNAQLTQNENALALQERILEEAIANIARCQEEKAAKIAQCEEWRTKWAEEKEQRTAEINIVKQVESIIATKLETMKDYLKDRADGDQE